MDLTSDNPLDQKMSDEDKLFQERMNKIEAEHTAIMATMKNLGDKFKSPRHVGEGMWDFYNYRLFLIDLKKNWRKVASAGATERKTLMDDMVKSIKHGTHVGSFKGDISLMPKNDKDREIVYNAAMSDIDYKNEFISAHLEFILDQISSVDKMIFGFESIIKFYDKYVNT